MVLDGHQIEMHLEDITLITQQAYAFRVVRHPYHVPRGSLSRNPFNHCACDKCRWRDFEPTRIREERRWRREVEAEITGA